MQTTSRLKAAPISAPPTLVKSHQPLSGATAVDVQTASSIDSWVDDRAQIGYSFAAIGVLPSDPPIQPKAISGSIETRSSLRSSRQRQPNSFSALPTGWSQLQRQPVMPSDETDTVTDTVNQPEGVVQRAPAHQGSATQTPQLSDEQRAKIATIIKSFTTVGPNQLQIMKEDAEEIKEILLEYSISDKDEKKILAKFKFWDNSDQDRNQELQKLINSRVLPEWPPAISKSLYLDNFIATCWRKSFWKGTFRTAGVKQFTDVFKDLYRELEDENLDQFKQYVQKSKTGREFAAEKVAEFPSFWKEVGLKTVVALPAGVTAAVGGALQSLPFEATEKAGEALKEQAKEYLKAVNYGDKKMIESAVGGSALVGEVTASIAQIGRGGPLATLGKIDQILKIIRGLSNTNDYLALKEKLTLFLEIESYSAQIQAWFANPEQIIEIMLGLKQNKVMDALENWSNRHSVPRKIKATSGGISGLLEKIARILDKIRHILHPIFEVRSGIVDLIEAMETVLGEFPAVEELLNMGKDPQQRTTEAFQTLLTQLSQEVAASVQRELKEIRQSFKMKVELFAAGDLVSEQQVAEVVTGFALQALPSKYQSIATVLRDRPEVKGAISEYLVKPLLPGVVLETVNQKIQTIAELVKPGADKIDSGFDMILTNLDVALQSALESSLKSATIQRSTSLQQTPTNLPENRLQLLMQQSSGAALEYDLRHEMENQFSFDFSQVRIHSDGAAQQANQYLLSDAFTLGHHLFFDQGKYAPTMPQGQRLLAHELTHVVQQSQGQQQETIQRAIREQLVATLAKRSLKWMEFKKFKDPTKESQAQKIRSEVSKLLEKPVISLSNPRLPDAYVYEVKAGKPHRIRLKSVWKPYHLPTLAIKKGIIKLGIFAHRRMGGSTKGEKAAPAPKATIDYGRVLKDGRRTGVKATITKKFIGKGTKANPKIQPPGFKSGDANHARGHLLGAQLGGSGDEKRNLVTLFHKPVNTPNMRGIENKVRKVVEAGEVVDYSATPEYETGQKMPVGIRIHAKGHLGFELKVYLKNKE